MVIIINNVIIIVIVVVIVIVFKVPVFLRALYLYLDPLTRQLPVNCNKIQIPKPGNFQFIVFWLKQCRNINIYKIIK